jgi:predicted methyltransferase
MVLAPRTPKLLLAALLGSTLACEKSSESVAPDAAPTREGDTGAAPAPAGELEARIQAILAGDHRSAEDKARDPWRHPAQTLAFFGVQPQDTVVELWAGAGWYTDVLAPLLREQGKLIVTQYSKEGPADSYRPKVAKAFEDKLAARPDLYDRVEVVVITDELVLAPEGSVDVVLTFRNSHGWFRDGQQEKIYGAAFRALRPGGVFGVVQHRAAPGADATKSAPTGYLPESAVIEAAQAVGFELAEKSEINANPRDTRDHPEGVWTLPPGFALGDKDRDKYAAIGESDRMTLKFVKPGG